MAQLAWMEWEEEEEEVLAWVEEEVEEEEEWEAANIIQVVPKELVTPSKHESRCVLTLYRVSQKKRAFAP